MKVEQLPFGAKFKISGISCTYQKVSVIRGRPGCTYALILEEAKVPTIAHVTGCEAVWLDAPKVTFGDIKVKEKFVFNGTSYTRLGIGSWQYLGYDGAAVRESDFIVLGFWNATTVERL